MKLLNLKNVKLRLGYAWACIFLNIIFFRSCVFKVIIKYDTIEVCQYILRGAVVVFPRSNFSSLKRFGFI